MSLLAMALWFASRARRKLADSMLQHRIVSHALHTMMANKDNVFLSFLLLFHSVSAGDLQIR
jgi:hypothetical protein